MCVGAWLEVYSDHPHVLGIPTTVLRFCPALGVVQVDTLVAFDAEGECRPLGGEHRLCNQFGRWEGRALSPGRDLHGCSGFEGTTAMKSPPRDYTAGTRRDVMGLYRESSLVASCRSGGLQSWNRGKSAPTGSEERTLCVRGRLRRNTHRLRLKSASCKRSKSRKSGKSLQVAAGGWTDGIE